MNPHKSHKRLSVSIQGAVQGVGFRPFIYRLANELELVGWVNNSAQGVLLEVEGSKEQLEIFLQRIQQEKPPHASIQSMTTSWLEPVGYRTFEIRPSTGGQKTTLIMPDRATCPDCLREILDPTDRRYRYPFTNCIRCGPRFSILEALPYDRAHTTMKNFRMCDRCQAEYEHPLDRRFHAQPNACPECGPQLVLWEADGSVRASGHEALLSTANALRRGSIVAIKGLGGFHLVVDARNREAVLRLRQRKQRIEKPFALLYPSFEMVQAQAEVSDVEEKLLRSPEAPIVLLRRRREAILAEPIEEVAPGNPYLGVMLPYTPLHHLLMAELGFPVVATSGNLANEPICTDEYEALQRLGPIADLFLVHDRPIARPVDDSIVRVVMDRSLMLRRARGYAPLPIQQQASLPPLLAVGAHLKNTIAISVDQHIFVSQHIGDLETVQARDTFRKTLTSFQQLYDLHPEAIVCDAHPDYPSTHYAQQSDLPVISVQHHSAHVFSCMADNNLTGPVLGIAWDGTGYGLDGTIWGGEYLSLPYGHPSPQAEREKADPSAVPLSVYGEGLGERSAHLRTFRLPGGAQAIKEPRRAAMGLLYALFGEAVFTMTDLAPIQAFSDQELEIVSKMLTNHLNAPRTSSVGRLFDAVSSLVGLRQQASFEGQAAMDLEFALEGVDTDEQYEFEMIELEKPFVIDWALIIQGVLEDLEDKVPAGKISAKFHNTLVETIITVAQRLGEKQIVLTGGCFQNKYLTERAIYRLRQENLEPYWHQQIPPNDGGIALGQVLAAAEILRR